MSDEKTNTKEQPEQTTPVPEDPTPQLPKGYIPLEDDATPLLSTNDDRWIIHAYSKKEDAEGMLIFEEEKVIVFLCADECATATDRQLAQIVGLFEVMSEEFKQAPRNRAMFARLNAAYSAYDARQRGMAPEQANDARPSVGGVCDECGSQRQLFQMYFAGKVSWLCGPCLQKLGKECLKKGRGQA